MLSDDVRALAAEIWRQVRPVSPTLALVTTLAERIRGLADNAERLDCVVAGRIRRQAEALTGRTIRRPFAPPPPADLHRLALRLAVAATDLSRRECPPVAGRRP